MGPDTLAVSGPFLLDGRSFERARARGERLEAEAQVGAVNHGIDFYLSVLLSEDGLIVSGGRTPFAGPELPHQRYHGSGRRLLGKQRAIGIG